MNSGGNSEGPGRLVWPSLGGAIGVAVGWWCSAPRLWPWAAVAIATLAASVLVRGPRARLLLMCVTAAALGAAWVAVRGHYMPRDDLRAAVGDEPRLVSIEGVVRSSPEMRRNGGSLAAFGRRRGSWRFEVDVHAPRRGRVLVLVDEHPGSARAGDRVTLTGMLYPPRAPSNPGGFDRRRFAALTGSAGVVVVKDASLLHVTPVARPSPAARWSRLRDAVRARAGAILLEHEAPGSARRTLLAAMLLGVRDEGFDEVGGGFRRAGMAHLLAISGLHLAVFAGVVLAVLARGGPRRRWHGVVAIALVVAYLTLVETRMPVLRAGVMTIVACLGIVAARSIRVGGLIALSAIVLLAWRPEQIVGAGFQLSFGVVIGLVVLAPRVRERWFGPPVMSPVGPGQVAGQWLASALASAATAWLVSLPLTLHHFGSVSVWAVPLSVIGVPLAALVVATGALRLLATPLVPAWSLDPAAAALCGLATLADAMPGSPIHVTPPSLGWVLAAEAWVVGWAVVRRPRWRRRLRVSAVVLVAWLLLPPLTARWSTALRIDMLAVGDGSCYVLRGGGGTVVFDAGSTHRPDVGGRVIVPALRRLGVGRIEAIVVSHANLDHYAGVLEIIDEFRVGRVIVTPQLRAEAAAAPDGSVAFLLERIAAAGVPVAEAAAGTTRTIGSTHWHWLHPPADLATTEPNETSMVVRVDAGSRRVLLCGDIEAGAVTRLLDGDADLAADVLELPHHGSFDPAAVELVRRVRPSVVLQSTGWARLEPDRWRGELAGVERLVTARDGACFVEIGRRGAIRTGRLRPDR